MYSILFISPIQPLFSVEYIKKVPVNIDALRMAKVQAWHCLFHSRDCLIEKKSSKFDLQQAKG